jgi:hypothetical protein
MNDRIQACSEIVRTGLLNVQHWFDHGSELLGQGVLGNWQHLVIMAERHLIQVIAALRGGLESGELGVQLDATIKSTNTFWYAALAWCARKAVRMDRTLERSMDRIYEKLDQVRWLLDCGEVIELTHARARLADDVYEAMAVPPVFELIRGEAERAAMELAGKDAHVVTIVERVTRELELRIEHARFLLEAHDGNDAQFQPLIDSAISAVDALYRAIGERVRMPARERIDRVIVGLVGMRVARAAA